MAILVNETMATTPLTGTIVGGTAAWNAGGYILLTPNSTFNNGAFEYTGTLASTFTCTFDMYTSPAGADAMWFYWGASTTPAGEGDGDGGYHVVFDDYTGANFPYRLMWNGTGNEFADAGTPGSPPFADGAWHTAKIEVYNDTISVYLDGSRVISVTDTHRTLGGTKYGWAARCGGGAAEHRIRNCIISDYSHTGTPGNIGRNFVVNNGMSRSEMAN